MGTDALLFECVGIKDRGKFPIEHTGRGRDLFKNFTHWLIWNIPATATIAGAIPGGRIVADFGNARQGFGYGWCKYAGPKPPKGKRHVYRFTIYALDSEIEVPFPLTKGHFLKQAKGHMIQQGSLTGEYE